MTCGQVFVCCSATTLGITVCCDTTIKPESVHYLLAIIRLLPFCCARLRYKLVSTLGLKSTRWVPTAIDLFPVRCLYVVFHWEGCIASTSRSSPKYRVHVATSLSLVSNTPIVIGISVRHVFVASSLILVHHGIGMHLFWFALPPTSMDVGLLFGESPWCSTGRLRLRGMRVDLTFPPLSKSIIVPILDFDSSGILLRVGSFPPTTGRSVSGIFFEGLYLWTGSGPLTYCRVFTIFS